MDVGLVGAVRFLCSKVCAEESVPQLWRPALEKRLARRAFTILLDLGPEEEVSCCVHAHAHDTLTLFTHAGEIGPPDAARFELADAGPGLPRTQGLEATFGRGGLALSRPAPAIVSPCMGLRARF